MTRIILEISVLMAVYFAGYRVGSYYTNKEWSESLHEAIRKAFEKEKK